MSKYKPITVEEAEIIEKRIQKQNPEKKPVALGSTLSKIGKRKGEYFPFDEDGNSNSKINRDNLLHGD